LEALWSTYEKAYSRELRALASWATAERTLSSGSSEPAARAILWGCATAHATSTAKTATYNHGKPAVSSDLRQPDPPRQPNLNHVTKQGNIKKNVYLATQNLLMQPGRNFADATNRFDVAS